MVVGAALTAAAAKQEDSAQIASRRAKINARISRMMDKTTAHLYSRSASISPPPLHSLDPDPRGEETEEDSNIRTSRSEATVDVCEEEDARLIENTTTNLPPFIDLVPPTFVWGDLDGSAFSVRIDEVYKEVVHWRRNFFEAPKCKEGLLFVSELSRLKVISDATAMESVALKAPMVLPALVLQRPHPRSSAKDHTRCLEDGLSRWLKGGINSLLHKCRWIQGSLHYQQQQSHDAGKRARSVEKLVSQGNVKATIRVITEQSGSGCLPLGSIQPDGRTVKDHLLDKHPPHNTSITVCYK